MLHHTRKVAAGRRRQPLVVAGGANMRGPGQTRATQGTTGKPAKPQQASIAGPSGPNSTSHIEGVDGRGVPDLNTNVLTIE